MKRITIGILTLLVMSLIIVIGTNTALCIYLIDTLHNFNGFGNISMESCTWSYPGPYPIPPSVTP